MKKAELDINELKDAYEKTPNLHKLAAQFHTSHLRISTIFKENNIPMQNIGRRQDFSEDELQSMIEDYTIRHISTTDIAEKYHIRLKRLREIFRERGVEISTWSVRRATFVPKPKKKRPPRHNQYQKYVHHSERELKLMNGAEYKECPLCGWKTVDVDNKAQSFAIHVTHTHGMSYKEYLEKYPQDAFYFKGDIEREKKVKCEICGEYRWMIDNRHLKKHNLTVQEYKEMFPHAKLVSDSTKEKLSNCYELMMNNQEWERHTSNAEQEINDYLKSLGLDTVMHDRTVLNGKEIDIYIPSLNIGIEYHGLVWHTELFGKKARDYHSNKVDECEAKGIRLISIFEDDYVRNPELTRKRLSIILDKFQGRTVSNPSYAYIDENTFANMCEKQNIELVPHVTHFIKCIDGENFCGALSFSILYNKEITLNQFVFEKEYNDTEIAQILIQQIISDYSTYKIKYSGDRCWFSALSDSVFDRLGFSKTINRTPNFRYYCYEINKHSRFSLEQMKQYSYDNNELEAKNIDRIWDCGTIDYEYLPKLENE